MGACIPEQAVRPEVVHVEADEQHGDEEHDGLGPLDGAHPVGEVREARQHERLDGRRHHHPRAEVHDELEREQVHLAHGLRHDDQLEAEVVAADPLEPGVAALDVEHEQVDDGQHAQVQAGGPHVQAQPVQVVDGGGVAHGAQQQEDGVDVRLDGRGDVQLPVVVLPSPVAVRAQVLVLHRYTRISH